MYALFPADEDAFDTLASVATGAGESGGTADVGGVSADDEGGGDDDIGSGDATDLFSLLRLALLRCLSSGSQASWASWLLQTIITMI